MRTKLGETRWIGAAAAVAVVVGLSVSGCAAGSKTADPAKVVPALAIAAAGDIGAQPEEVLPANAIVFAKVNLNPSVAQKVALFGLASKFPDIKNKGTEKTPIKESVFGSILTERTASTSANSGLGLDYKKDVEPWLGDRIGVGVFPDINDDAMPEVAVAIQVTDEKAAKVALDRAFAHLNTAALLRQKAASVGAGVAGAPPASVKPNPISGYAFTDGYVILSDTSAHAAALAKAGKAGSLAKTSYAEDVKKLGPDQIAIVWADVAAAYKAIPADQLEKALGPLKESMKGIGDPKNASGRVVMGLHAEPSFLEVTGKAIDVKGMGSPVQAAGTGTALIATFPAEALGAVSVTGLGKQVGALYTSFTATGDSLGIKQALDAVGIRSAKQIETLLGAETGVMVGTRLQPAGQLQVTVRTRGSDADAALVIARGVLAMAPAGKLDSGKVTGPDGIVVGWRSSLTTAALSQSGSKLGATEAFKQVMPDAGVADFAAYVDLAKVISTSMNNPQDAASLKPLKALGMTATGGAEPGFRFRLSVR